MTFKKLKKQEKIVEKILEEIPASRNDDYILYAEVIRRYYPDVEKIGFVEVLENAKILGLPSYESITRNRRKITEIGRRPDLASDKVKEMRKGQETEYRAYAKL